MLKKNTKQKTSVSVPPEANEFADALSRGKTRRVRVAEEQADALCGLLSDPPPPTSELRRAALRAPRFKVIGK
jgi:uncharacterized protein (DUF1778 family)